MTVKECYEKMGANYEDALSRLLDDTRIKKYLLKYVEKNELADLESALKDKRWKDLFMYAHNMKGFGLNLSLTQIHKSSDILCESVRSGEPNQDVEPLFKAVKEAHENMFAAVKELGAD